MSDQNENSELKAENTRLISLLEQHRIEWRLPSTKPPTDEAVKKNSLSTEEKIKIFRDLFRGRTDVYPIRWESRTSGKSGYSPACANEWLSGVCEKPRIKCGDCGNRLLVPLTDSVIYDHLAGEHTIGIYPLMDDDSCYFLAVDFDDENWQEDAKAFSKSCTSLGVPCALEISRSGQGAHAWIFFKERVSARDARRLGTALISHTCTSTRQLKLASYDRLFPNQDSMPKGGFGNLIALPLQKGPRENGRSIFVNADLEPFHDQWTFLSGIKPMSAIDIDPTVLQATGKTHPLDVTFIDDEDLDTPWKSLTNSNKKLSVPLPKSLQITLSNLIYFEKSELPQQLANRLIRLAAFQNPEFYKAQAMRMSVWDTPRVIGCAENFPKHIAIPRGCLDAAHSLMMDNNINCHLLDERFSGDPLDVIFAGQLRSDQEFAVNQMLKYDTGVLCAPTAFGKTVAAASIISRRGVSTLILVHRTELLKQWQERLNVFLDVGKGIIGTIGGGNSKPTGRIDIAVMQSVSRQGEVNPLVEKYGQIIVDECHHVGATSFDAILKKTKAKFVLGLTATPIRRDGLQPIIFMQCGPIRHKANRSASAPNDLEVRPVSRHDEIKLGSDAGIQDVFRHLANDVLRTQSIAMEIKTAFKSGRKVLVLTERTEHLDAIRVALEEKELTPFVLHGRMSKKQRASLIQELNALPPESPRILLASGKLVGEGFDHPPLDTLVLAMPVSWRGTLQQYAGRLHREHASKTDVRIIDFVDTGHPALLRMWVKRQNGYKVMGYRIAREDDLWTDAQEAVKIPRVVNLKS